MGFPKDTLLLRPKLYAEFILWNDYEAVNPAWVLLMRIRRLRLVSNKFNRIALDAHFQHNSLLAVIHTLNVQQTDHRLLSESQWQSATLKRERYNKYRWASLIEGTFNMHPVFLANTKHLTIDAGRPPSRLALRQTLGKVRQLVFVNTSLISVTIRQDRICKKWVVKFQDEVRKIVEDKNAQIASRHKLVLEFAGEPCRQLRKPSGFISMGLNLNYRDDSGESGGDDSEGKSGTDPDDSDGW